MNMPLNRNVLEDALAMANVKMSLADCMAQVLGDKPMTKPVAEVVDKVRAGEFIKPVHEEPTSKPERKKETEPRAKRTVIADRKNMILIDLKNTHKKADEIADSLKMKTATVLNWLYRMEIDGVVHKQHLCGRAVLWFLPDYTHPFIDEYKSAHERREIAMRQRDQYYEAFKCLQCGSTKRTTQRNRCLSCTQGQAREFYHSINAQQESTQ